MSVDKKIYRILDANFNRAKEGLRVCEDVCRFILDSKPLTKKYKDIRHNLTNIMSSLNLMEIIKFRNIQQDVGRPSSIAELQRKEIKDIFYANSQRVKESLRVLEECLKIVKKSLSLELKEMRYNIYAIEKKIIEKF